MSFKNILVAFNGTDSSTSALRYAASMARRNGAYVTAILAHSEHEVVNSRAAWVPREATKIIENANAEFLDGIEAKFEDLRAALELDDKLAFMRVPGRVDTVLSECAQVHDVLVVGQDQASDADPHVSIHNDKIALMSGRPVLVIPKGYEAKKADGPAVLAWDGGRAAARALADAMDLLKMQTKVTVITVGDLELARPIGEVIAYLNRHGIDASHTALDTGRSVAQTILDYCDENKASILVMGAYEHSKFREDFFGGVTARILFESPGPILLSH